MEQRQTIGSRSASFVPIGKPELPGELKFLLEFAVSRNEMRRRCGTPLARLSAPSLRGARRTRHLLEPENFMGPVSASNCLQPFQHRACGLIGAEICWQPVVDVRSRDRGVPGRDCQLMQIGHDIPHRIDALYRGLLMRIHLQGA